MMDHWSNLNLNQYSRLPAASGLSSNASSINPFDLGHVIDQRGFAGTGLGAGLSSPLPAHGRFSSLTHVNYPTLHGSMPLFDTMAAQLSGAFPGQTPYKPVAQSMYSLESQAQRLPSIMQSQIPSQLKSPSSLFNSYPHTMNDSPSFSSNASLSPLPSESSKTWQRPSFMQAAASANPYSGLPMEVAGSRGFGGGKTAASSKEPPPAHSGSRPSTIQRVPYKQPVAQQPQNTGNRGSNTGSSATQVTSRYISTANDPSPPTAHANTQRLEVNLMQRLLLSNSQYFMDNSGERVPQETATGSALAVSKAMGNNEQSRTGIQQGLFAGGNDNSAERQHAVFAPKMTSSGQTSSQPTANRINQSGYQTLAQVQQSLTSGYGAVVGFAGQNAALLTYSPAVVEPYETVSSPETNDCLNTSDHSSMFLGSMLMGNDNNQGRNQMLSLQQSRLGLANSVAANATVDAVQAIADSTTRPKRGGGRAGKGGNAKTGLMQGSCSGEGSGLMEELADRGRRGKSRRGGVAGGQSRNQKYQANMDERQEAEGTVGMLLEKGYCQGVINSPFGQLVPSMFGQGDIQYADAGFLARQTDPYQVLHQTESGMAMGDVRDACGYAKIQQQQQQQQQQESQVYMTNNFGNSFVNPNEILPMEETLGNFLGVEHDLNSGDVMDYLTQQKKLTGKSEPKEKPPPVDEEFCHLLSDPAGGSNANRIATDAPKTTVSGVSTTATATDPAKSGFINCFMSFVQGKKQETLSSVSNVPIINKPVLPKYIPDTRPRRVEEPAKSSNTGSSASKMDAARNRTKAEMKTPPTIKTTSTVSAVSASSILTSVEFSDDESTSNSNSKQRGISKTVNKVLSTLDRESKGKVGFSTLPIKGKLNIPTPQLKKQQEAVKLNRPKAKTSKKLGKKGHNEDNNEDVSDGASSTDEPQAKKAKLRERSIRKAKQKIENSRQKGGKSLFVESDESLQSDVVELSSAESDKEGYDSDKDPAWIPVKPDHRGLKKHAISYQSDSEDEKSFNNKKLGSAIKANPDKTGTMARESTKVLKTSLPTGEQQSTDVSKSTNLNSTDAPHNYQKGDFVLDKRDEKNYVDFAIWKIDSGRLLQKFEPVQRDGSLVHQSTSTYSSWTDNIQSNYIAVGTKMVSANRTLETVEVLEKYRPKPPPAENQENPPPSSGETEKPQSTDLQDAFNIYIQILISQCLETTFLNSLHQEPDRYYMDPLEKIDNLLIQHKQKIYNAAHWTEAFSANANRFSSYSFIDMTYEGGPCQATADASIKGEKVVKFYGIVYNPDRMEITETVDEKNGEDYLVGQQTVLYLPVYHCLQHFKFQLFQLCQTKVDEVKGKGVSEDHQVLDLCLQDQEWMQKMLNRLTDSTRIADKLFPSNVTKPSNV